MENWQLNRHLYLQHDTRDGSEIILQGTWNFGWDLITFNIDKQVAIEGRTYVCMFEFNKIRLVEEKYFETFEILDDQVLRSATLMSLCQQNIEIHLQIQLSFTIIHESALVLFLIFLLIAWCNLRTTSEPRYYAFSKYTFGIGDYSVHFRAL